MALSYIKEAEYLLIALGNGLSYETGAAIYGERLYNVMGDFAKSNIYMDMNDGFRLPYAPEQRWAFMTRYAYANCYSLQPSPVYEDIKSIVKGKPYFAVSSVYDNLAQKAGLSLSKIFRSRGGADKMQCACACHDKTYSFDLLCADMLACGKTVRIPSKLVPKCPICGKDMTLNVDIYNPNFVEDERYKEEYDHYYSYLHKAKKHKLLLLELGERDSLSSGKFNARYVFDHLTKHAPHTRLIRINKYEAYAKPESINKSVCFNEDICEVLKDIRQSLDGTPSKSCSGVPDELFTGGRKYVPYSLR